MPRATDPGYGTYTPQSAATIGKLIALLVNNPQQGFGVSDYAPGMTGGMPAGVSDVLGPTQSQAIIDRMLQDPNNQVQTPGLNDLQLLAKQRLATGGGASAAPDPLAKLLQQGQALMGGGSGGFDYESARGDILGQINKAYAPMIAAIRGQSKHAKKETAANQAELGDLYSALARFDNRSANRESARTSKEALALKRLGSRTTNQIGNVTDRSVNQERQLLRGLGIQAAGGETISPLIKEGQRQQNEAIRSSTGAQRMARGQGANQADFLSSLASSAKLEGTNAQADALTQLQNYLGQNRLSIAGVLGQEAQARAQALQQLAASAASSSGDQFANWNTLFDNILAARNQSFQEAQAQADSAGQQGIEQYLPQGYQNATSILQGRPQLLELLQTLMAQPSFVAGKQVLPDHSTEPITPEYAMQQIAQLAAQAKIQDPNNLALLRAAALALYGS